MNNSLQHFPTVKQGILLGLRSILYSIGAGIMMGMILVVTGTHDKTIIALLTLISYAVAMSLTVWVGFAKFQKTEELPLKLKFNGFSITAAAVCIIIVLAMPFINDPIQELFPIPEYFKKMFETMSETNIFSITVLIVAAPVLEEILFRGIILDGFLKNYSPQKAILVSAAIFAVVHLNPWQAIPAFLGGLLMGWMYWKTNSIIPGMIIHFANNLYALLLSIKFNDPKSLLMLTGIKMYVLIFVFSTLIIAICAVYLNKYFKGYPVIVELEPIIVTEAEE